ncbi:hypothetical protein FRC09_007917, partial [Ceratobasidium sp. 395]
MLNGDSDSPVYATDSNIKPAKQTRRDSGDQQNSQWLLHHQDDGAVLLQNKLFGKYIGIATDLKPNVTLVATNSAIKFIMEHAQDDSYKIYAQNGDEKLYLFLHPNWNTSPKVAL